MSDALWPHGLQDTRLLCPPLFPGVCSNSCPLSRRCYLPISSSASSFCLQSFPESESFPMSRLITSDGHNIGASASASVRLINGGGGDLVTKSCPTLVTPVDCSPPSSSVHGFSRQEYWGGLPFPSPGIFPTQELNPGLLHCRPILYWLSYF